MYGSVESDFGHASCLPALRMSRAGSEHLVHAFTLYTYSYETEGLEEGVTANDGGHLLKGILTTL